MIVTVNDEKYDYLIEDYLKQLGSVQNFTSENLRDGFEEYVRRMESEDVAAYLWGRLEVRSEDNNRKGGVRWNGIQSW